MFLQLPVPYENNDQSHAVHPYISPYHHFVAIPDATTFNRAMRGGNKMADAGIIGPIA
jgi:hypothetical protein